jgi:hypothetical protein
MYGYQQCVTWFSWFIFIIIRVLHSQRGGCCNAHHCFAVFFVPICHGGHHLSLVRNWINKCCICSIFIILHVLSSKRGGCCNGSLLFLDTEAVISYWCEELNQIDWRSKCTMGTSSAVSYGVADLYLSKYSHVLNSQSSSCWNAHHYFAFIHSYLPQRPSAFVTGEELNQNGWRSTSMDVPAVCQMV